MNEAPGTKAPLPTDADVESLLQVAGRRSRLSENEVTPILQATRAHWRLRVGEHARQRRLRLAAALAAVLTLAIGLGVYRMTQMAQTAPVRLAGDARSADTPPTVSGTSDSTIGSLELETGDVAVLGPDGESAGHEILVAGSVVTTGSGGRVAFRFIDGTSVRIDGGSVVRIGTGIVDLERGALYVDSGSDSSRGSTGAGLAIATPVGSVRHVGTQFEVRLSEETTAEAAGALALRVRVREGVVIVEHAGTSSEAGAGTELVVYGTGRAERRPLATHGTGWEWVERTAPPIDIENATLAVFLEWASRETGLPWRYATPSLRHQAQDVILHGSIDGLTPDEALAVVLPGCGLRHRRLERALVLEELDP